MKCRYKTIPCCQMTSNEVDACSRLFSENYGIWSQAADEKLRGKRVKLSPDRLREMFVSRPNRHVTMMFDGDSLVGHVFYIRADSPWSHSRKITFVQQLVLDKKYRGRRFGLKMLQSVFGLSSDDAWGLYTSNPLTIRALEDATFRRISINGIQRKRTRRFCRKSENLFHDMQTREDFLKLVKLPASTNIQKTGEVFKGPLLLLNPDTGVAYRKEQFIVESDLPREYVIVDKRYAADDLCRLFRGFDVMDIRYVRAGRWNECLPSDAPHAKEVFGVFRKRGHALIPFADVLHRFSERATRKVSNRGCAAQLNLK